MGPGNMNFKQEILWLVAQQVSTHQILSLGCLFWTLHQRMPWHKAQAKTGVTKPKL